MKYHYKRGKYAAWDGWGEYYGLEWQKRGNRLFRRTSSKTIEELLEEEEAIPARGRKRKKPRQKTIVVRITEKYTYDFIHFFKNSYVKEFAYMRDALKAINRPEVIFYRFEQGGPES